MVLEDVLLKDVKSLTPLAEAVTTSLCAEVYPKEREQVTPQAALESILVGSALLAAEGEKESLEKRLVGRLVGLVVQSQ